MGWRRTDRTPPPPAQSQAMVQPTRERPSAPSVESGSTPASPAASAAASASAAPSAPVAPGASEAASTGQAPSDNRPAELEQRVQAVRDQARAASNLDELRAAVAGCRACALAESRTQTVFSDGDGSAEVMFVGEAPGYHEDAQGVPFVGPAGELLTDIIEKGMRLERKTVSICNVLKCRPPENRDPTVEEKALCTPWLDRQIELAAPRVIIPLGRHASGHMLRSEAPMGQMRGRVHERDGRPVVPTYHPAYLLRSPEMKRVCWKDIQLAMGLLKPSDG